MPVSAKTRYYAQKPGAAGFSARATITDDLITRSLENKRQTALQTTQMDNAAAQRREETQQTAQTARQSIIQAGDLALQQLRGKQETQQRSSAQLNEMAQIQARGDEQRKTADYSYEIEKRGLEYFLDRLKKGKVKGKFNYKGNEVDTAAPDEEEIPTALDVSL